MAALTKIQPLSLQGGVARVTSPRSRKVLGSTKILAGAMVGLTAAGFARPFAAGDDFGGHARETVDNTDGGDGDLRVECYAGTYTLTVAVFASVTIANVGDPVQGVTDNHADLLQSSTDQVGKIGDVNENGVAVQFETVDFGA